MSQKFLVRYIILILVLLLAAGAAWYVTEYTGEPYEDAVLVRLPECEQVPERGQLPERDRSHEYGQLSAHVQLLAWERSPECECLLKYGQLPEGEGLSGLAGHERGDKLEVAAYVG